MGTFTITVTNNTAVITTNLTTGSFDVQDGVPSTLINGYTQSNRNFNAKVNLLPYMPGFANVATSADGTFDVGNPLPGFSPSVGLISAFNVKIHPLSLGEYVKGTRSFINSPNNVIGPYAGFPSGLFNIFFNINDYSSYFILMSDLYELDIFSATFNCFLPQYNVTFAPYDLGFVISGNYVIINDSNHWEILNMTRIGATDFKPGEIAKLHSTDNNTDFSSIDDVEFMRKTTILFQTFIIKVNILYRSIPYILFQIPPDITPDNYLTSITDSGKQFNGSAYVTTLTISAVNRSGVYTIIPGQNYDTLYENLSSGNSTANYPIAPNFKTGFIDG